MLISCCMCYNKINMKLHYLNNHANKEDRKKRV